MSQASSHACISIVGVDGLNGPIQQVAVVRIATGQDRSFPEILLPAASLDNECKDPILFDLTSYVGVRVQSNPFIEGDKRVLV